jgi:RNA polymerase sigma-70 factor (ECF subfamily)
MIHEGFDEGSRTAIFTEHRRLLFSIAYRMLGSVADAEDALQDAFIRWARASGSDIRSPKAFLVTMMTRLCINHLQSAHVQRETYVGEWLPEPLVTEPGSDVLRIAEVDESVSMAMLLLLERLTPVERAVFLLREVFDYTHAEIAAMLDLTEMNCRQLLRRARQHVRSERHRFSTSGPQHKELLERFHRAAAGGDMQGLLAMLSRDVVMHTDGGGKASALMQPIYGPDKVARASVYGLTKLMALNPLHRLVEFNGQPGIVTYVAGRPQSVFTIEVVDELVHTIYIVTNPDKLSHLPPPPF